MSSYTFSMTRELYEQLNRSKSKLPHVVRKKYDEIIPRFLEDPFSIKLTPITHAVEEELYATHLDGYRMVWKRIQSDIVILYIGQHDPSYRRAKRLFFRLDKNLVRVGNVSEDPKEQFPVREEKGFFGFLRRGGGGKLFAKWSDKDLSHDGVPQEHLPTLRVMKSLSDLKGFEGVVSDNVFDKLYQKALEVTEVPVVPPKKLSDSLAKYEGGFDLVRFSNSNEFRQALEGDMEDWMLFLTPTQRKFVHYNFSGPARVRGVAGSGKTVVAIHRARVMAQRLIKDRQYERILFLTFGNRLPDINMHLLKRLTNHGPEVEVIECRSLYSWVGSLLQYQQHLWVDLTYRDHKHFQVDHAYRDHEIPMQESSLRDHKHFQVDDTGNQPSLFLRKAIERVKPQYPDLKLWDRPVEFFREEIGYRIKGHNARNLDIYLKLPGTGRGTPLHERTRHAMFEVFEIYEQQMKEASIVDYEDLILHALERIDPARHKFRYMGAVVDEIQDLTEVTMKLIRKMVPNNRDDLFLVGDGAQRIYPGGYSLSDTGIDIKNRGANLRFNYRNTQQIMRLSNTVLEGAVIDDMDEDEIVTNFPNPKNTIREGEVPVLHECLTPQHEMEAIAEEIRDLRQKHHFEDKDFAILYRIRNPYQDLAQHWLSQQLGCQVVVLNESAKTFFGSGVKATTLHSAKGLEFKVVFIVGVSDHLLPFFHESPDALTPSELNNHIQKERALFYVGVTRARDILYLTYPRSGGLSRFLEVVPEEILCRLE